MPDRNGKIFYTSITSLSHISKCTRHVAAVSLYPHLLAASLTLLSGHIPSISGPSENLPTYVFQVRFPPRKHGVRGNECQKRSVVSVWYAQNSLPFCTEACYTTLTGCEDPTKMLIRVCILLQMQPVPLTGTTTREVASINMDHKRMQPVPLTGTTTRSWPSSASPGPRCSPHPSRGQQHVGSVDW